MDWTLVPAYAYLAGVSAVLAVIDIRQHLLPNVLTLTSYPILMVLLALPAFVDDNWGAWTRSVTASMLTLAIFTSLAVFSSGSFGMGDAKLAGFLAMPLAWSSWAHTLMAMAGAFVLSALVSVALLLLHRATRHSLIPFGPFLIAATWIVTVLGWTSIADVGLLF